MNSSAPFLVDDTDVSALRKILSSLSRISYNETCISERLGLSDLTELQWRALPIYRAERLFRREPLDLAIELFLFQSSLTIDELNRLFSATDQKTLCRTGLLSIGETCTALASLFPVGETRIFSDHAWPGITQVEPVEVPHTQVMSIGTDSRWLARTTVRRKIGSTLDLCTGSGIHALLAAPHSERVVAVDINPRAAQCTRFNALASGASNIEVAVGDLFDPVLGERFDLITANPPFVPSPVNTLGFRDGGQSGEEVQRRIIEGLPHHLAPGGIAQIVTELGERDDESLGDRLRSWLGDAPMNILILRLRVHSAASYAIGHADGDGTYTDFFNSVHAWSANLNTQGYTRIASVLLAFQWSDPALGSPWTRIEDAQPPKRNASSEIEALFETERMARQPISRDILMDHHVERTGPIALTETQVLGFNLDSTTNAHLFGTEFAIVESIAPIERDILIHLENPLSFSELLSLANTLHLTDETLFAVIRSLLQRGFIRICKNNCS